MILHLLALDFLMARFIEISSVFPLMLLSMNPNMSQYITKWKLKFLWQEWIKKYKILSGVRPSAPTPGLEKEIALVQRMAGINVTGELDFETKKLFVIPRCGNTGEANELSLYGEARQRRRKRDSTDDYLAGACEKLNVSENEKCVKTQI